MRSIENLKDIQYRKTVRSSLYLANSIQLNIAFAVNVVNRNQSNYTWEDWIKVKRILRCLKGTSNLGLNYKGKSEKIECYVNASLVTNDKKGRSTTSFILKVFDDVIYWWMKKQTHVVLSSAEVEFITMSTVCREMIYIKKMGRRLLHTDKIPIMYEDNQAG